MSEHDEIARRHGLSADTLREIQAVTQDTDLDDDERELQTRYGLSAEDVKRVRGETWAERCEDAKRLASLAEPTSIRERARRHLEEMNHPNIGEMLELGRDKQEDTKRLLELMHPAESNADGTDDTEGEA
jgi:hypothetical protein